jgi:diguanylate cyclase (GGDEF)-like protein/putative nucleotidyltransferase with HDIG domain
MTHPVRLLGERRRGVKSRSSPCRTRADLLARLSDTSSDRGASLLLVADLDGFREYNARHGYEAGDALLRDVGNRLAGVGDAYYLGADSFALVLEDAPLGPARALPLAVDALTIREPETLQCSFGAVLAQHEGDGCAALAVAEARLEDQKRRGLVFADRVGELLLLLMHAHDPELRTHAAEVARLSEALAERLGLGMAERALVRRAAEFHDVGKLAISRAVLDKAGRLDDAEWELIRAHPVVGAELLQPLPSLNAVASLVRATHERHDGAGYPDGVRGEDVPLAARIVAVCDAYHAMVSERPYAAARSVEDACAELEACAGTQFDRGVVTALVAELADRRLARADALSNSFDNGSLHGLARLHALLESASVVDHPDELPGALDAVAQVIGETLGFGAVVINLYRHEWDDFVVGTVYGEDPQIKGLLGSTYGWEMWESVLDRRFLRAGAYTVYAGDYDWNEQSGHRVVPELELAEDPDAWQGEDEIFVPFRHADGHILGIFNVGLPLSGRRPSDDELHVLTTVVRHAARAVQRAQETSASAAHRRALERLLHISSKLTETASGTSVLEAISVGISEALGFSRVTVHLHDVETGALRPAAAAGFELDDPRVQLPFPLADLQRMFEPRYEIEGCFLVPLQEAEAQLPSLNNGVYQSTNNGRGPWAWQRHWLAVPLNDWNGVCLGVVFADDPVDRLLPSKERLQALRLFANQATVALESVAQYEAQRYLAEHDSLTKLRNRHSFMVELEAAVHDSRAQGNELALVYCDLDAFKELNDAGGHAVGDQVLARFGSVLVQSVRQLDLAFRIGGDEFAMLLRGCGCEEARRVVERTIAAWEREAQGDLLLRSVAASFGIAVLDAAGELRAEDLLRRADEAMYEAKRSKSVLRIAA